MLEVNASEDRSRAITKHASSTHPANDIFSHFPSNIASARGKASSSSSPWREEIVNNANTSRVITISRFSSRMQLRTRALPSSPHRYVSPRFTVFHAGEFTINCRISCLFNRKFLRPFSQRKNSFRSTLHFACCMIFLQDLRIF